MVGPTGPSNKLIIRLVRGPAGTAAKDKGIGSAVLNASRVARGSNVITFLLSCATTSLLGGITEWKNRYLLRRKCVIIYPLMIAGKEFSAGINGHMGSVAGDLPSHSDVFWRTLFNSEAARKSDNLALNLWGFMLPVVDFLLTPGLDEANVTQQQGSDVENPFKGSIYDSMSATDRDLKSLEFNSFVDRLLGTTQSSNNKNIESNSGNVYTGNGIVTNPNVQSPDNTIVNIPTSRSISNRVVYKGSGNSETSKSLIDDLNLIAVQQSWNTIGISSAHRSSEENARVGGKPHSRHLSHTAIDISSINNIALKTREGKKLGDILVTQLSSLGYHTTDTRGGRGRFIWQRDNHFDHIHADTG